MISRSFYLCLAVLAAVATAFAPSEPPTRASKWSAKTSTYAPMKRVGFATPPASVSRSRYTKNGKLFMSSDAEADALAEATKLREQAQKLREEAAEAAGVPVEDLVAAAVAKAAALKNGGTVYDDAPQLEPERENVSSAMKERLVREAQTGLDSEKGQTNVILYIGLAIALLVAAGGQGILY